MAELGIFGALEQNLRDAAMPVEIARLRRRQLVAGVEEILQKSDIPLHKNTCILKFGAEVREEAKKAKEWVSAAPMIIHDEYGSKVFANGDSAALRKLQPDPALTFVAGVWKLPEDEKFTLEAY
jgi:hypothetical protein